MKIKNVILLCGLAVAFAAASVWVFLSGGNNAKAVRTKFRLGGLLLTVSSMLSLTSCKGGFIGGPTCYDTVAPQCILLTTGDDSQAVKVGDTVEISIRYSPYEVHSYKIFTNPENVIQSGKLESVDGSYKITIQPTEHRGAVEVEIYGVDDEGEYRIGGGSLRIE